MFDDNDIKKRLYSGKSVDVSSFDRGIMPPHPSVFIKKSCYEEFGLFNTSFKIAADYDLLFRFLKLQNLKFLYDPRILINMKLGGLSNSGISSIININKEIFKIHKINGYPISIFSLLKKIPIRINEMINKNG